MTQLYSAKLTRQEERKGLQGLCKALWLVGLLYLQEALLKVQPYIFLLAVITSLLTNYSM
jgi:hypothetical protein